MVILPLELPQCEFGILVNLLVLLLEPLQAVLQRPDQRLVQIFFSSLRSSSTSG